MSRVTGRVHTLLLVRMSTTRVRLSFLGYNFSISPFNQVLRGKFGSTIITTSSTSYGGFSDVYFTRGIRLGRFSQTHRCQNRFAILATHPNLLGIGQPEELPMREWFAVIASSSRWSRETWVSGLELTVCSAFASSVDNVSSLNVFFNIFGNVVFMHPINLSQASPIWGELGGMKTQLKPLFMAKSRCASESSAFMASLNSWLAPRRLVPLPEYITCDNPYGMPCVVPPW